MSTWLVFQIEKDRELPSGIIVTEYRYIIALPSDNDVVESVLLEGEEVATTTWLDDAIGGSTSIIWPGKAEGEGNEQSAS